MRGRKYGFWGKLPRMGNLRPASFGLPLRMIAKFMGARAVSEHNAPARDVPRATSADTAI